MHKVHSLYTMIDEAIPQSIRPSIVNVILSTANIEFCMKMISLSLSSAYLIYKWRKESKQK